MRRLDALRILLLAAWAGAAASCSDSGSPPDDGGSKPPSELSIVHVAPTSTPLVSTTVSFYAKRGENREGSLSFQGSGVVEGEEYVRLRIDANTLLALPNGDPIVPGDSVLITLSVVDQSEMLFDLQPTGLKFSPADPAELKIHYDHANGDINDDGVSNALDDALERTLAIWRQENPGDPFVRLTSVLTIETNEVTADLTGFSRYALAY